MIAKAIPMKTATKSHFGQLVAYITNDQDTPFRLGQVNVTNCYCDQPDDAILEVLNTQLQNRRAISDKTYHLIISFKAGEQPGSDTLKAIEDGICNGLGFEGHQRISAVHGDTDNLHIHIAINKVHPLKHTIHNPFQDYKTLAKLCSQLEQQYGLEIDNHSAQRNHTASKARDMEAHAGIESLISWIQIHVLDKIKQTNDWHNLHSVLYENGLRINSRGSGFSISTLDGTTGVKASSVARDLSKGKLEQRLGQFQPADEQMLVAIIVKQRYERKPIIGKTNPVETLPQALKSPISNAKALFSLYQQQMAEKTHYRNQALTTARAQHQNELQRAKAAAADKRRWIKTLIQPGVNKKLLLTLVGKDLQHTIQRINTVYKTKRRQLFGQHRRKTWLDWLQHQASQGNREALHVLRQQHSSVDLKGHFLGGQHSKTTSYDLNLPKAKITKQGTVFYLRDNAVIKDDGNRFHMASDAGHDVLTAALIEAKKRFGYRLTVQGNNQFQENVVRESVKAGLNISFDSETLERRRVQLTAEMSLFGQPIVETATATQRRGGRR